MKEEKRHPWRGLLPVFLLGGLVLLLAGALYVQKRILPQQIRTVQMNLNVPIRYAFISDNKENQIVVLDIYDNHVVNQLQTIVPAQLLAVSRLGGYLLYARRGGKTLYHVDLETLDDSHQAFSLVEPLISLAVTADGFRMVAVTENHTWLLNKQGQVLKRIDTQGQVTTTFSADGKSLLIAEQNEGRLSRYDLMTLQSETLAKVDGELSPISVTSDNRAVIFSGKSNDTTTLYRYDVVASRLDSTTLATDFLRPYVTADNAHVLITGQSENAHGLYLLSAESLAVIRHYPLPKNHVGSSLLADNIRTGWLEQTALLADNHSLYVFDLTDETAAVKHYDFGEDIRSWLVSADSKILLATLAESSSLLIFDVRKQAIVKQLKLPLAQADNVIMGQTNTLCH